MREIKRYKVVHRKLKEDQIKAHESKKVKNKTIDQKLMKLLTRNKGKYQWRQKFQKVGILCIW